MNDGYAAAIKYTHTIAEHMASLDIDLSLV
jgi:hypothetical protein